MHLKESSRSSPFASRSNSHVFLNIWINQEIEQDGIPEPVSEERYPLLYSLARESLQGSQDQRLEKWAFVARSFLPQTREDTANDGYMKKGLGLRLIL